MPRERWRWALFLTNYPVVELVSQAMIDALRVLAEAVLQVCGAVLYLGWVLGQETVRGVQVLGGWWKAPRGKRRVGGKR